MTRSLTHRRLVTTVITTIAAAGLFASNAIAMYPYNYYNNDNYDYNYNDPYYDDTYRNDRYNSTYPYDYNYDYNDNYSSSSSYRSSSCGTRRFTCARGSTPRCVNREWACFRTGDTSYRSDDYYSTNYNNYANYNNRRSVRTRASVINNDPCWATPPDCGRWTRRCTSEGWRCDPPSGGRYDNYNYDRNYNNDRYDDYSFDRCRPTVACDGLNDSCPSRSYCGRYRQGYACIPTDCRN